MYLKICKQYYNISAEYYNEVSLWMHEAYGWIYTIIIHTIFNQNSFGSYI